MNPFEDPLQTVVDSYVRNWLESSNHDLTIVPPPTFPVQVGEALWQNGVERGLPSFFNRQDQKDYFLRQVEYCCSVTLRKLRMEGYAIDRGEGYRTVGIRHSRAADPSKLEDIQNKMRDRQKKYEYRIFRENEAIFGSNGAIRMKIIKDVEFVKQLRPQDMQSYVNNLITTLRTENLLT